MGTHKLFWGYVQVLHVLRLAVSWWLALAGVALGAQYGGPRMAHVYLTGMHASLEVCMGYGAQTPYEIRKTA